MAVAVEEAGETGGTLNVGTTVGDAAVQNYIKRGCPLGNDKWMEARTQKAGLQMTLRGRPRKVPDICYEVSCQLL